MNEKYLKSILWQVKEVADKFYGTKVEMKMEKQEVVFDTVVTSFHMKFENKVFIAAKEAEAKVKESSMPVRAAILFEMFPFCILFSVSWICLDSKPPISKSNNVIYRTIPHFTIQHLEFFAILFDDFSKWILPEVLVQKFEKSSITEKSQRLKLTYFLLDLLQDQKS